jgi:hypothetical protein
MNCRSKFCITRFSDAAKRMSRALIEIFQSMGFSTPFAVETATHHPINKDSTNKVFSSLLMVSQSQ